MVTFSYDRMSVMSEKTKYKAYFQNAYVNKRVLSGDEIMVFKILNDNDGNMLSIVLLSVKH